MTLLKFDIQIESAFATPVVGDTLFGQLCWAIRMRLGNERLSQLLEGYRNGSPFLVVSDMLPQGVLPRPTVPQFLLTSVSSLDAKQRKVQKGKRWLPIIKSTLPMNCWLDNALQNDAELLASLGVDTQRKLVDETMHQHNSLNRLTNTTGKGAGFAPYQQPRIWYNTQLVWQVYCVLDEQRLTVSECQQVIADVGLSGFGRDASSGLGKFTVNSVSVIDPPVSTGYWLTLAPSALAQHDFVAEHSYYQTLVRFGRHGNSAVHSSNPFKKPVLLAQTGALLAEAAPTDRQFVGHGISEVSESMPETVHQGYAPVWPVTLQEA